MDNKKFIFATLAGGVAYFVLGFLVYAILLDSFFATHTIKGIAKTGEQMKYYPLIIGNFAHGALLAFIFLKWTNIKSFAAGASAGAAIGLCMTAGFDLVGYDTMKVMSIIGTGIDIVAYTVITTIVGGIVGAVIGMGKSS